MKIHTSRKTKIFIEQERKKKWSVRRNANPISTHKWFVWFFCLLWIISCWIQGQINLLRMFLPSRWLNQHNYYQKNAAFFFSIRISEKKKRRSGSEIMTKTNLMILHQNHIRSSYSVTKCHSHRDRFDASIPSEGERGQR